MHSCQHLLFLVFLIETILTVVRWYLIMVLLCISVMIHDAEHFPMYLLIIFLFYLEKRLFIFSPHFFYWTFFVVVDIYVIFIYFGH